jgi:hypothetical protein
MLEPALREPQGRPAHDSSRNDPEPRTASREPRAANRDPYVDAHFLLSLVTPGIGTGGTARLPSVSSGGVRS